PRAAPPGGCGPPEEPPPRGRGRGVRPHVLRGAGGGARGSADGGARWRGDRDGPPPGGPRDGRRRGRGPRPPREWVLRQDRRPSAPALPDRDRAPPETRRDRTPERGLRPTDRAPAAPLGGPPDPARLRPPSERVRGAH